MASLYYWLICWHWEILLGTPSSTENSSLLHKGILRLNPTMAGQHCCIYMDKKVEKKDVLVSFPSFLISNGQGLGQFLCLLCASDPCLPNPAFYSCSSVCSSVFPVAVTSQCGGWWLNNSFYSPSHILGDFVRVFVCFVFIFSLPEHVAPVCLGWLSLLGGVKNTPFQNKTNILDPFGPIFPIKNLFNLRNSASSPVCTLCFGLLSVWL